MKIIYSLNDKRNGLVAEFKEATDRTGKYYAIDIYPKGKEYGRIRYLKMYDVLDNSEATAQFIYREWYIKYNKDMEYLIND